MVCKAHRPNYLMPTAHKAIQKPTEPFTVVHVDLFFLPEQKDYPNNIALLMVDACTKYIMIELLPN